MDSKKVKDAYNEYLFALMRKKRVGGNSRHKLYGIWHAMLDRCYNPDNANFYCYGACNIRVDERWWDFSNFIADMEPRPAGLTLERIDPNKSYSKDNCTWATWEDQHKNKRKRKYIPKEQRKRLCQAFNW